MLAIYYVICYFSTISIQITCVHYLISFYLRYYKKSNHFSYLTIFQKRFYISYILRLGICLTNCLTKCLIFGRFCDFLSLSTLYLFKKTCITIFYLLWKSKVLKILNSLLLFICKIGNGKLCNHKKYEELTIISNWILLKNFFEETFSSYMIILCILSEAY